MTNATPPRGAPDAAEATGFGMTDLEERLRGPEGPVARRAATDRLTAIDARIEVELARGASPERYERLAALRHAVTLAARVVAPDP